MLGLYPSAQAEQERKLELKPVLGVKARVAYVKALRPGESVSYHRAFTATEPERVATLPAGYSDGFPRALAGKGSILVTGRRCSILAITANATVVRLSDAPAAPGDEAVLIRHPGRGSGVGQRCGQVDRKQRVRRGDGDERAAAAGLRLTRISHRK